MNLREAIRASKRVISEYSAKSVELVDIFFLECISPLVGGRARLNLHSRAQVGQVTKEQGREGMKAAYSPVMPVN